MTRTLLAMLLITIPAYAEAGPCPTAVTGAVGKAFPRATITSCKAEHEHGKDSYEVKVTKASGEKIEVDVAPDGAILQVEESIALDAVPDAVKKAFAARYPKARPTGADKLTAGTTVRYEIAFTADKRHKSATFAADGAFVEEE